MDVLLYIAGALLLIAGLVGALIPVLPGPPLGFLGLLALHSTETFQFNPLYLWAFGLMAGLVTVLDYIIPIWGTRVFGGTKAGARGATIGLILGVVFAGPIGIIVGPFMGAWVAEMIENSDNMKKAFLSALGSLLGFLAGTGLKLAYGVGVILYALIHWISA